jgi:hypothetical protein
LGTFKPEKDFVANLIACHFLEWYGATNMPEENCGILRE